MTNACQNARCGDGIVRADADEGESCDDGNEINTDVPDECQAARCGTGSPVKTSPRAPRAMGRATTATTTTMTPATTVDTLRRWCEATDLSGADEGAEACDDGNEEDGTTAQRLRHRHLR